jgi:acyl-CoA thioester hydrolase
MNFPVFTYPIKILEHHIDAYGHVNNVAYIALFEEARWDMITSKGCGLDYVRSSAIGPVVLEIQCKFRRELRLRQDVLIRSSMQSWRGKIGVMRQTIEDRDGTIFCEALITMGFFDLHARRLVPPGSDWSQALGITI